MKSFLAAVLCLMIPLSAFAADNNAYKVTYDGGSLTSLKSGTNVRLGIEPKTIKIVHDKEDIVAIPADSITEITYGQDVHRRIGTAIGLAVVSLGIGALMALSKSKKHFIGLTWANGEQKGASQCSATKMSIGEFWLHSKASPERRQSTQTQ